MYRFIILLSIIGLSLGDVPGVSDLIVSCKGVLASDDMEKCLLTALHSNKEVMASGAPDTLSIPSLDPADMGGHSVMKDADGFHLEGGLYNISMKGLKDTDVKALKVDYKTKKFHGEATIPFLKLSGNYALKTDLGQMVINGKGTFWMEIDEVNIIMDTDIFVKDFGGKPRLQISKSTLKITPEDFSFRFNNLINGDEVLDNAANAMLLANRKELFILLHDDVADFVDKFIEKNVNNGLQRMDIDDMAGAEELKKTFKI